MAVETAARAPALHPSWAIRTPLRLPRLQLMASTPYLHQCRRAGIRQFRIPLEVTLLHLHLPQVALPTLQKASYLIPFLQGRATLPILHLLEQGSTATLLTLYHPAQFLHPKAPPAVVRPTLRDLQDPDLSHHQARRAQALFHRPAKLTHFLPHNRSLRPRYMVKLGLRLQEQKQARPRLQILLLTLRPAHRHSEPPKARLTTPPTLPWITRPQVML